MSYLSNKIHINNLKITQILNFLLLDMETCDIVLEHMPPDPSISIN